MSLKNPLNSYITGNGSKRPKKYYSDKDAKHYAFTPDHSEYYVWSKEEDYIWMTSWIDEDFSDTDEPTGRVDIDVIHTPWTASVIAKTSDNIVNTIYKKEKKKTIWSTLLSKQKRRDLDEYELWWYEEEDSIEDIYRNARSIANNHATMSANMLHNHRSDSDNRSDPYFKKRKNTLARNTKTNSNYRPWQWEPTEDELNEQAYAHELHEDIWLEAWNTKSELEEILDSKPHIIWSDQDEIWTHKKAA